MLYKVSSTFATQQGFTSATADPVVKLFYPSSAFTEEVYYKPLNSTTFASTAGFILTSAATIAVVPDGGAAATAGSILGLCGVSFAAPPGGPLEGAVEVGVGAAVG